jgi:hypothetical protein
MLKISRWSHGLYNGFLRLHFVFLRQILNRNASENTKDGHRIFYSRISECGALAMCITIVIENADLVADPDEPILSGWMTPGFIEIKDDL